MAPDGPIPSSTDHPDVVRPCPSTGTAEGRPAGPSADATHLVPGDHVDLDAVARSRAALAGNGHGAVLDLGRVRSWDRDALPAMAALLDGAPGSLRVVGPPARSFLEVLDAADVRGIWVVFDDVRRLRRAAARRRR